MRTPLAQIIMTWRKWVNLSLVRRDPMLLECSYTVLLSTSPRLSSCPWFDFPVICMLMTFIFPAHFVPCVSRVPMKPLHVGVSNQLRYDISHPFDICTTHLFLLKETKDILLLSAFLFPLTDDTHPDLPCFKAHSLSIRSKVLSLVCFLAKFIFSTFLFLNHLFFRCLLSLVLFPPLELSSALLELFACHIHWRHIG